MKKKNYTDLGAKNNFLRLDEVENEDDYSANDEQELFIDGRESSMTN